MAWTKATFQGDEAQINKLVSKMYSLASMTNLGTKEDGFADPQWVGYIAKYVLEKEDYNEDRRNNWIDCYTTGNDEEVIITFESAWQAPHDLILEIADKFGLKAGYYTKEPGMCIYDVYDPHDVLDYHPAFAPSCSDCYIKSEVINADGKQEVVEECLAGEPTYGSIEELIRSSVGILLDLKPGMSPVEVLAAAKKYNQEHDGNSFCGVYEFDYMP